MTTATTAPAAPVQITAEGARVCCWAATGKSAGRYAQLYTGKIYEAVRRKSDGVLTWRAVGEFGGTRSGKRSPSLKFVEELHAAAEHPWRMVRHGDVCQ